MARPECMKIKKVPSYDVNAPLTEASSKTKAQNDQCTQKATVPSITQYIKYSAGGEKLSHELFKFSTGYLGGALKKNSFSFFK